MTYRILYNFNKVKKEGSFIEADGRINKWRYDPLFIFDDTLIHQSFNEEDDLRYCAFIDIIRPSHFEKYNEINTQWYWSCFEKYQGCIL